LGSDCNRAESLSITFGTFIGFTRQTWEPILSDTQIQKIHQLAEPNLECRFLLPACLVVAFHAKNIWSEDELARRLFALKTYNIFIPIGNNKNKNESINNMLKQMGEVGRKYLTSEKP
jgi:hypothetical protein